MKCVHELNFHSLCVPCVFVFFFFSVSGLTFVKEGGGGA